MAANTSCSSAVTSAVTALEALPGFATTVVEILALLEAAVAAEFGLATITQLAALAALLRRARAQAAAISTSAASALNSAINCVASWLAANGGTAMACVNTHSSKVPGAGLCCNAVAQGLLILPPGTATLPVYTSGSESNFPHVQVTDAGGHCATCMIVGSRSAKHPGRPVLKFIRGGLGCPTTRTGCCALATA